MLIALDDGSVLRGDFVVRAVQRFDLVPIPSTLELLVRSDSSLTPRMTEGQVIVAGSSNDRYTVVKVRRAVSDWNQGAAGVAEVLDITAVLEAFAPLFRPASRAVVKESASMSEAYRACGAIARVSDDVTCWRFYCFAGDYPTVGLARVLQEEAAAPVWTAAGALRFVRLGDLFGGEAVLQLNRDATRVVESSALEQHEIPRGLGLDADGAVRLGRLTAPRAAAFLPHAPARVLDNLSRCLVVRRTMEGTYAGTLRAGDGIDVAGARHVITTVAHVWDNGSGGAPAEQTSRVWLAQLQR